MAITNTKLSHTYWGNRKVVFGKSVIGGGATGGAISLDTMGLKIVTHFKGTVKAAAASPCSCTATFPTSADITIITANINETVYWMAIGIPG